MLARALQLTVWGMGMTFASIGALALGMLALTYLTSGKRRKHSIAEEISEEAIEAVLESDAQSTAAQAAAAAVSVALADRAAAKAAAAAAAVAVSLNEGASAPRADQVSADGAWNGYVRGMHLSRRACYESRRFRN